jgi:hypothetical protein
MRKIDWKEDGSDLMDDAEIYYQEAINTHKGEREQIGKKCSMLLKQWSQELKQR